MECPDHSWTWLEILLRVWNASACGSICHQNDCAFEHGIIGTFFFVVCIVMGRYHEFGDMCGFKMSVCGPLERPSNESPQERDIGKHFDHRGPLLPFRNLREISNRLNCNHGRKEKCPPETKNFHRTGYLAGHSRGCPASHTRSKQEAFTTMSVTTVIPKGSPEWRHSWLCLAMRSTIMDLGFTASFNNKSMRSSTRPYRTLLMTMSKASSGTHLRSRCPSRFPRLGPRLQHLLRRDGIDSGRELIKRIQVLLTAR
jgi:hypothetical protein